MKLQADQKPLGKRKRADNSASDEPAAKRTLFNFLRPLLSKEKQDEIDQTLLEYIIADKSKHSINTFLFSVKFLLFIFV